MTKTKRSTDADPSELIIPCDFKTCERKFLTFMGMRTHLKMVHNISYKTRKIDPNSTFCSSCKTEFKTNKSLIAHGSSEVCAKRRAKGWKILICQNQSCNKVFEKYAGRSGNRKGLKFCSIECSTKIVSLRVYSHTCFVCKKDFKSNSSKSKYCNLECKNSERKSRSLSKIKRQKVGPRYIFCSMCKKEFFANTTTRKFCSNKCSFAGRDLSNNGGLRPGGGRSKNFHHTVKSGEIMYLNREEIRVANFLDSLPINWTRNSKGFPYVTLEGKNRKFYPDFYIEDYDLYIEYKGWVTDDMLHKMRDSFDKNSDLNLFIIVGESVRFSHVGVSIQDLEDKKEFIPNNCSNLALKF